MPDQFLESHFERELLRYAVSRAMFCPDCQAILDVRRAVLIERELDGQSAISCVECWTKYVRGLRRRGVAVPVEGIKVTDGRHFDLEGFAVENPVDSWTRE